MTLAETSGLLALNLILSLAAMAGLWALSRRWTGIGFIDAAWPTTMAALAGASFLLTDGDPVRKGLLLWLVVIWAAPQAWRRLSGGARREADGRYSAVARRVATERGWSRDRTELLLFFLPQGALAWLVALPVQLGPVAFSPAVGWLGWAGAVLAVAGIGLEGVGSLKTHSPLAAAPAGRVRRWLRRPEYLGDLAVWWGLFLIAAETGPGRASLMGPIFLTFVLAHWAQTENPRRERDGG
ncbi:DUF1295 domain-containing protein [Brevundimonas basaltis]|uniref:Steroid 5-alpha reductase family enzyme n=1 Tax=Brevundimonas basaltis TaxID=472166 RepID=A0A7W8MHK2_9CAUL|nr:DUF1295 domain-containing protein [Brevundimonas basaltis]MBB5292739.1 steroid 5-alpha reductase family enzyme [Brevundimonas basaltis]